MLGHISLRDLLKLSRSDEDVGVEREKTCRDEAEHHVEMEQILEFVPLESRGLDVHDLRAMIRHPASS